MTTNVLKEYKDSNILIPQTSQTMGPGRIVEKFQEWANDCRKLIESVCIVPRLPSREYQHVQKCDPDHHP